MKTLPRLSTLFSKDNAAPGPTPWRQQLAVAMQWHGVISAAEKQGKR